MRLIAQVVAVLKDNHFSILSWGEERKKLCQRQFSSFLNMINILVKVGDKNVIRNGEGRSRCKSGRQRGKNGKAL